MVLGGAGQPLNVGSLPSGLCSALAPPAMILDISDDDIEAIDIIFASDAAEYLLPAESLPSPYLLESRNCATRSVTMGADIGGTGLAYPLVVWLLAISCWTCATATGVGCTGAYGVGSR